MIDGNFWDKIDLNEGHLSRKRRKLYTYAFGKPLSLDEIREKVVSELLT